jgi:hypothetical protein
MTSIAREGGSDATVAAFAATVARHFGAEFGREARTVGLGDVGLEAAPATVGGER